jgi:hypothetical protein
MKGMGTGGIGRRREVSYRNKKARPAGITGTRTNGPREVIKTAVVVNATMMTGAREQMTVGDIRDPIDGRLTMTRTGESSGTQGTALWMREASPGVNAQERTSAGAAKWRGTHKDRLAGIISSMTKGVTGAVDGGVLPATPPSALIPVLGPGPVPPHLRDLCIVRRTIQDVAPAHPAGIIAGTPPLIHVSLSPTNP